VAAGPLQVTITLATLFALGVAYVYGHRYAVISEAIRHSVNEAHGVIFIILAIGAVIAGLYLAGTVAAFVYYGVELLSPRFFYVTIFILTSVLSILTGSSFTTIGAVGVAFVGLAPLMGVSPVITAGAAVSGAFLGDKTARISDTFVLTAAVIGVDPDEHSRFVWRTAIPTWILSAVLFTILGLTATVPDVPINPADVQNTIGEYFNISLLALIPVMAIFVLSAARISGFLSLMIAALIAIVLAAFTQPVLIANLAQDPDLNYLRAVIKVGIDVIAEGFHLNSGNPQLDQLFAGGGTFAMFETIWLILVAAAFGGVVGHTGMIQRVVAPVIDWADNSFKLILATVLTTMGLNVLTADSYVAILLGGRMFRGAYIDHKLKPAILSGTIADSGSIFSPIIPWNVHGAFVGGALGLNVLTLAPFAFMCYLSPVMTIVLAAISLRRDKLPDDADAAEVYGEEPAELPTPQLSA
jgi:NhaC family Na+:H+ antiporter